jgi:hypothetical protein
MLRRATLSLAALCLVVIPAALSWVQESGAKQEGSSSTSEQKLQTGCGEPYCAESSHKIFPARPVMAPKANQVFQDPDFGSRMVRVTDENGIDGSLREFSFGSNSSAEINEWGKFDPSLGPNGGYYFYVGTSGGGIVIYSMDASTMHVTPHCEWGPRCRLPQPGSFSYVDPHILYGHFDSNNLIQGYDVRTSKVATIYDLSKCPGLPADLGGYPGSISNSGDDTKFSGYAGGKGQGGGSLVTYYDRTSGHCCWYDTGTGRLGGSAMPVTQQTVGVVPAPHDPTLKAVSGNLSPGDYYVKITVRTRRPSELGETLPSPEAHIHLDSQAGIEILPAEFENPYAMSLVGFNVYIGTEPGKETRQASTDGVQNAYTQSAPLARGDPPPSVPTAGFNVHNARLSRDGEAIKVIPTGSQTLYIWKPKSATISACSTHGEANAAGVASFCGGHTVLGYTHLINHGGPGQTFSLLYRPLSDLNDMKRLIPAEESLHVGMDTHWSWNNDNPSDTAPVCGAFSGSGERKQGDGTSNPSTNPILAIRQAWEGEVVCVATTGPPKMWRFAHHHATGTSNASSKSGGFGSLAIGNVSQDGKFYLFGSDWDWTLGSQFRSAGCPTSGKCREDVFIVELK